MAIKVSQAFERTSAQPIDATLAITKAQMLTVNDNLMPDYYFTVCQDDGCIYLYDKTATASVTTGKFTKFEGGGDSIQVTTLPTAGASEVDKIYQYIGATTASYTNGYFYKCLHNGSSYSWTQYNVQPSSGSGGGSGTIIDATLLAASWNSTTRQQTVTFTGYDSDMGGVIGVPVAATSAQKEAFAEAVINVVSVSGTSFTFECDKIPSIDLPVTLYAGGGGGTGSGGHTILNNAGTAQAQRANLQFKNATVSDDSTNDKTVVETEQIQYATMPTADATNVGQIAQYIGTTTSVAPIYTNGLFYECVEDSSTTPSTYSWEIKDVQTYPEVDLTNVFASGMPAASIVGPIGYSTEEKVVGTWIDGKPIYQKTFECGAITTGTSKEIAHGISNISKVVDISGIAINSSNNIALHITYSYVGGSSPQTITAEYHGSKIIVFPIGIGTGYEVYVTLRYTKTTD